MIRVLLVLAVPLALFCLGYIVNWVRVRWGLRALRRQVYELHARHVELAEWNEALHHQRELLRNELVEALEADEVDMPFLNASTRQAMEAILSYTNERKP